jgi:uncharacterized protein with PIN domain
VKPRLYLDEDIMPLFARLLRARGHDVVSAHEVGATALGDEDQLERASELGRTILTWNYKDFIRISQECAAANIPHGGIIISYHHYKANEISVGVEIISNLMNAIDGEDLQNCLYRLQDFR